MKMRGLVYRAGLTQGYRERAEAVEWKKKEYAKKLIAHRASSIRESRVSNNNNGVCRRSGDSLPPEGNPAMSV
jgi:hypothetical protein